MIVSWISVKDRLPNKDGSYICCVKNGLAKDYDVICLYFAKRLNRTNTNFSQFNKYENYKDVYDRPGFYFTCETHWKAEEIEIDDGNAFEPDLVVTHWMEFPDSPFKQII